MLSAKGLTKRYGTATAVSGLSFDVRAGEAVGLLGPNGAGKTTTLRLLTGYLQPDEGSVTIFGVDAAADPLGARRRLGYLPEDNPLYDELEVSEALQFWGVVRGLSDPTRRLGRVKDALRRCGLKAVLGKRVRELSKGYRQRLGLAQALVHEPEALVLDEPTSGLDPNQTAELRGLIGELKASRTVLLSTHLLAEAEASCDRVLILGGGKLLAEGAPADLRSAASRRALLVELKAPREDARRALAALPGAAACRDEGTTLALEPEGAADLREAVFRLAAERGWPILHLSERRPTLESLFRELTEAR